MKLLLSIGKVFEKFLKGLKSTFFFERLFLVGFSHIKLWFLWKIVYRSIYSRTVFSTWKRSQKFERQYHSYFSRIVFENIDPRDLIMESRYFSLIVSVVYEDWMDQISITVFSRGLDMFSR